MKKISKILSIILAISMVISMLPATFAADGDTEMTDAGYKIVYDFVDTYTDAFYMERGKTSTELAVQNILKKSYDYTYGFWMLGEGGDSYPSFNHYYNSTASGVRVYFQTSGNRYWFTMKIKVPVAGMYVPVLEHDKYQHSTDANNHFEDELDVYILDGSTTTEDIVAKLANANDTDGLIGTVDSKGNATGVVTELSGKELEAKEYLVVFHAKNLKNIRIKNFTLTSGDGSLLVPMYAETTLSDDTLDAGENETATLDITKILMSDTTWVEGDAVDALGITYESSDENVATVENGVVTSKVKGTAIISAKLGDYTLVEKTITVEDSSLCGVKVIYPFSSKIAYSSDVVSDPSKIVYTSQYSNGRLAWHSQNVNALSFGSYALAIHFNNSADNYAAYKIYVPAEGKYVVRQKYAYDVNGTANNMYIVYGNVQVEEISAAINKKNMVMTVDCSLPEGKTAPTGSQMQAQGEDIPEVKANWTAPKPGEYTVIWTGAGTKLNTWSRHYAKLGDLTLDGGDGVALTGGSIKANDSTITKGSSTNVSAAGYLSTTGAALNSFTYTSSNPAVATVDASSGVVAAQSGGVAKITATCAEAIDGYNSVSALIAVDEPTTEVSFGADASVDGITITTDVDDYEQGKVVSVDINTPVEVTAPETYGNYVFRGWVRGNADGGRVISLNTTEKFTIMTNTYLTAIYTEAANEEYYAWNGEFLGTSNVTAPTVLGYGFKEWAEQIISDDLTRFVAQYEQLTATYGVTYNGNTTQHKYDDPVTLTSDENVYWYRDGKLVDYGTEYTFNVWDKTEITTSSEGHNLPKVVLDAKAKDGNYMVEYDANGNQIIEVGILFNADTDNAPTVESCKEKMNSQRDLSEEEHGQFAAKADSYTKARGYLIYRDGGDYKVIYSE